MTNKPAVIYLLKDKFHIYSPVLPQLLEFRFTPEVVRDLDVINVEMLENLIKAFIVNAKLPPSDLTFVLADNTYFSKDFVNAATPKPGQPEVKPTPQSLDVTKELLQKQANQFIEHVPFDNVVSKSIPLKTGIKVVATNKDFFESIAVAFEHQGFTTAIVLPGLIFGNSLSAKPALDRQNANYFLQHAPSFKQYNLLSQAAVYQPIVEETGEVDEVEDEKDTAGKPNKKRLIALVGVFASLIIVLVIVIVQSMNPPSPPQQPIQADNTLPPIVPPTATPVVMESQSVGSSAAALAVRIQTNTANTTTAQSLRTALTTYKFSGVTLQTDNTVNSAATLINFSSATPTAVRNAVLEEVRKFKTNITVQETQQGSIDISIILGN